ncbi:MAG: PAS domain S-box protein [Verrucomicrobia bacterium]|nr:PAS domain S-box protein [Verrucomicrobiota bacterium]
MADHGTTPVRQLLLVEDNPGDASLLRSHLSDLPGQRFEVLHAITLRQALDSLGNRTFDLVLLDLSLPDSQGIHTFSKLNEAHPHLPIIVLTGFESEELASEALMGGAQDYLPKRDLDSRLLGRSIRYAIERKRGEEALARERDLLYTIIDNVPDRIFIKDKDSRFLKTNRSLARRFGLVHPREMIGRSDSDFFAPEHAMAARQDELKVMQTGQPMLDKIEQETLPDGSVSWVITSKIPLLDPHGGLMGTCGISRDVTDLKRIEQELAAERNLLRSLIDHLPDYIYAKDDFCRYTLDNEAHRRLLGVEHMDEILGRKVTDFFPPALAGQYDSDDQAIVRGGRPLINHEEPAVDRAGNKRWHSTTKVPLRAEDGRVAGLVCITRDITETRQAQEKVQRANSELARSREELMRALTDLQASHRQLKEAQGQLIQAEKMQSIGRLAAGVAHEVKNPLAIIRMGLDHLAQEIPPGSAEAQLTLRDMREAVQRADGIILGLLDFAKPRELNAALQELNPVVDHAVGMIRYVARQSKVRFVRDLAAELPLVWVDSDKVKQALLNLFTNAIHALETGGTATVKTFAKTLEPADIVGTSDSRITHGFHPGDRVAAIQIKDNGPGIPLDKIRNIYDPFFTTKEPGKGTGLGLSVTRRLVEMHGGRIDIRNRKSGGVTVTIWLACGKQV